MNDKYFVSFADLPACNIIIILPVSERNEPSCRIPLGKSSHCFSQRLPLQKVPGLKFY